MSETVSLTDLHATAAFARTVSAQLRPGVVVLLVGELGAGKTTFTKFVAEALQIDEEVTSPTFTILRAYEASFDFGPGTLLHLDAYRLGDSRGLEALGLDELLDDGAVALIEWGDLVSDAFPDAARLTFAVHDDDTRSVTVEGLAGPARVRATESTAGTPC